MASARIGMFDSGLGGLSVLRAVRALVPGVSVHYYADSAHCPYGGRSAADIVARAMAISEGLIAQQCQLIVVACNTATIAAVESLRQVYPLPFVGMEPAIKPAVAATRSGIIGVLATGAALAGDRFLRLMETHARGVRVLTQPCPGLVECVEAGDLDSAELRQRVRRYVRPLVDAGADTLVLGCTHYPFLRPLIAEAAGPGVELLDTGAAVARQVLRVLVREGIDVQGSGDAEFSWTSSGDRDAIAPRLQRLLALPATADEQLLARQAAAAACGPLP